MRSGSVALLVGIGLLAGCGDDDAPAMDDAGARCASNADCDDGVWCNGLEQCLPDEPSADARGCIGGSMPCGPGQACDDASESCGPDCSDPDADGDGVDAAECGGEDCDDTDPGRYPGNAEVCDLEGVDEDCDPETFGDRDLDRDGFVDARCCNGERCGEDCDETRRGTNPTVPEVCDGRDNDCDGMVDEELLESRYADVDRDLHGDPEEEVLACPGRAGTSASMLDCDDGNIYVNTPQGEIVDGEDNDCDGRTDEDPVEVVWYPDEDGDGFGDGGGETIRSDTFQSGYSILPSDCDDGDADRNPGALELCNAIDDDCSGEADYEIGVNDWEDDDGDGFPDVNCPGSGGVRDCDDTDPATHPGQFEICDLRDNDCDGTIDESCSDERPDAGVDAGLGMDAGSMDAGSIDAGTVDAGPVDAGPDAGPPTDGVIAWSFTIEGEAPTADACTAARIDRVRFRLDSATFPAAATAPCAAGVVELPYWQGEAGPAYLEALDERGAVVPDAAGSLLEVFRFAGLGAGEMRAEIGPADFTATRPAGWEVCDGFDNDGDGMERATCGAQIVDLAVSSFPRRACGLRERGSLVCWDGDTSAGPPADEPDLRYARKVAIGRSSAGVLQTCVLDFDLRVRCKGPNVLGALGVAEADVGTCTRGATEYPCSEEYVFVENVEQAIDVGVGEDYACALLQNTRVMCWGSTENGRTGTGTDPLETPRRIDARLVRFGGDPLDGVRELAVGPWAACARRADGTVACWGRGEILGDGFAEDQGDARLVDGLTDAAHVAVGSLHACASTTTGSGYCWGNRSDGKLGGGSFGIGDVAASPETVSIAAGSLLGLSSSTSVAALDGGSVVYWGSIGIFDPMLMGTTSFDRPRLTSVPASGVTGVEVGGWACFLYADGSVRCYGGGSDEGLVDL